MEEGADQTPFGRKLTVSDAALKLGLSAEAVRSRIKRGTLDSVKEGATVYVLLAPDQTRPDNTKATTEHDRAHAQTAGQLALVESLQDQVAYLREQLAEEREARRRADTIIAQLSQANATLARRVPELEPPRVPRGSPVSDEEGPPYGTAPEAAEESLHHVPYTEASPGWRGHTEEPRVPWWRRWFG